MRHFGAELLRATNRSTAALIAFGAAFTVFAMVNAGPQHRPPAWGFQQAAIFVATLLMGRAATVAATDFSAGTIRPWLISAPRRGAAFAGKLGATLTVTVIGCLTIALIGYAAAAALGPPGGSMSAAVGGLVVAAAGLGLFGHAAGVATRSVPVALTVTVGWVLPAEAVLSGRSAALDRWLPGQLLHDVSLGHAPAGMGMASTVLHAVIPLLLLEAIAFVLFGRRDVTS
jgi:hypothetical protein